MNSRSDYPINQVYVSKDEEDEKDYRIEIIENNEGSSDKEEISQSTEDEEKTAYSQSFQDKEKLLIVKVFKKAS